MMTTIALTDNNDRSLRRMQSEQSDTSTPLFMESISYDDDNDDDDDAEKEEEVGNRENVDHDAINENFVNSSDGMELTTSQQEQEQSPPMHHHDRDTTPSPTITMIRSRRNNTNIGGDSPGYSGEGGDRFCNLKKKRFRDIGGIDYEPVETGERGEGPDSNDNIVLLSSTTTTTTTTTTMGGGRGSAAALGCGKVRRFCHNTSRQILRTTVSIMNFIARILLWGSFIATIVGVVWYSHELKMNGTDSHLIAWFSAGAFVILGFPISMCGIIMHLKNYYQPNVQCYVVRILWMVPIYSISSWLCLRFFTYAIYMETLRDFYESYVLYSFFQYLIEVLGGEETLVLMLKDKSPTRGAHIWGLGLCMTPWAMGQPSLTLASVTTSPKRPTKRGVRWTSPFFVRCKFGVLQYVILKFFSAIFVMLLERYGLYKEGDFTPRGGYLYIAILTNLSQCWALYCLVFFYYALKNELGPIRPVGKFVSVKALVFFTWWQSLGISILFQMDMIPHYTSLTNGREWSSEAVAKGMQDWLICIEMFIAAIVHTFVFPHTDYLEPLGILQRSGSTRMIGTRRLGRKGRGHIYRRHDDNKSAGSNSSAGSADLELGSGVYSPLAYQTGYDLEVNTGDCDTIDESDHMDSEVNNTSDSRQRHAVNPKHERQGFVRALLDSTLLPRDVIDESVGIFKGEFNVEKKTLLQHAATSDEYDLFSRSSKRQKSNRRTQKKESSR